MSFRIFFAIPLLAFAGAFVWFAASDYPEDWWQVFSALFYGGFLASIGVPLLVAGIRKSWDGAK